MLKDWFESLKFILSSIFLENILILCFVATKQGKLF